MLAFCKMKFLIGISLLWFCAGCSAIPDVRHATQIHNPFPQLKRVAILPFNNQSNEPTVDQTAVTEAYYAAVQGTPGFEVLPVGVVRNQLEAFASVYGPPSSGKDFQIFAQMMGVDAVVQGSVTDFSPYYPPRLGLAVHWYAANPGFHPIPPGYGLPWGTKAEKDIPSRVVLDTEFELARQQMATQTPLIPDFLVAGPTSQTAPKRRPSAQAVPPASPPPFPSNSPPANHPAETEEGIQNHVEPPHENDFTSVVAVSDVDPVSYFEDVDSNAAGDGKRGTPQEWQPKRASKAIVSNDQQSIPSPILDQTFSQESEQAVPYVYDSTEIDPYEMGSPMEESFDPAAAQQMANQMAAAEMLPPEWPDPTGLIPDPPLPVRPVSEPQYKPVLSHTRLYDGADSEFTERLANHVSVSDEKRSTGWQAYLRRSDDFIRFCCRLHLTEMLEARGGAEQSDLILRWPISRYESQ